MTAPTRPAKLRIDYPRPKLIHDHTTLFREPEYKDGQPYDEPDEEDDSEGAE